MKWLYEKGCPMDEYIFAEAAGNGNFSFLQRCDATRWSTYANTLVENRKWLYEKACTCNTFTFEKTAENVNLSRLSSYANALVENRKMKRVVLGIKKYLMNH